jgi:CHAD domain-containing protein
MARSKESIQPVETLHKLTTSLEAASVECLAKPRKKAVHNLRTSTRRIEAQLELFTLLQNLPSVEKPRKKILRLLARLRRAASQVRDLDVQLDLIASESTSKNGSRPSPRRRTEAGALSRSLQQKRDKQARKLLKLLQQEEIRLPNTLHKLRDALAPARSTTLTESRLIGLVRAFYGEHTEALQPAKLPSDSKGLHEIRKRAKLARYLAESAPASAAKAHRLAARFERLQQAGGAWHDWLLLAEVAARKLGESAELPPRFAAQAERSLHTFQRQLRYKM